MRTPPYIQNIENIVPSSLSSGLFVPGLETSTLVNIARDIVALQESAPPFDPRDADRPTLHDWSKTLVAFPGIIARSETGTFLEPLFWISQDLRWAVTATGQVRLGRQICDDRR